jgi:ribonuclease HII
MNAPTCAFERRLRERGFNRIAGVDEAGRGPLAGPVVAAALLFPDDTTASAFDVRDSKSLSEAQRNRLYDAIAASPIRWCVALAESPVIDRINILQASLKAMSDALYNLSPDAALVDGNRSPVAYFADGFHPEVVTVVRGDTKVWSIAAASVIAKVTRDRLMLRYDAEYPEYGFARHKGYPSAEHLRAIAKYGVCPIHRRTFRGVRERCESPDAC